jgi:hypothetical protein
MKEGKNASLRIFVTTQGQARAVWSGLFWALGRVVQTSVRLNFYLESTFTENTAWPFIDLPNLHKKITYRIGIAKALPIVGVLMMVNRTRDYWVFGLCPSSSILETQFSGAGYVSEKLYSLEYRMMEKVPKSQSSSCAITCRSTHSSFGLWSTFVSSTVCSSENIIKLISFKLRTYLLL